MCRVTFDLDTRVLKDGLGIERSYAYAEIERALESIRYTRVQHSTYVRRDFRRRAFHRHPQGVERCRVVWEGGI